MRAPLLVSVIGLTACGSTDIVSDLAFVDGRAVAASGDSVLAYTAQGHRGVLVYNQRVGTVTTRVTDVLTSPHHVQEIGGRWYVSDIRNGDASIAVFDADWSLVRRISLDRAVSAHQFAVLEDGRLVFEATDGALKAMSGDSISTFARIDTGTRTSLLVAAQGGVLHAVPGKTLTLFNAQGNLRWRQQWPWHDEAYVTDLSIDASGRIHLLAGEDGSNLFVAFTLSPITGEVVRWSQPGPAATFIVSPMGAITPDSASKWLVGLDRQTSGTH